MFTSRNRLDFNKAFTKLLVETLILRFLNIKYVNSRKAFLPTPLIAKFRSGD